MDVKVPAAARPAQARHPLAPNLQHLAVRGPGGHADLLHAIDQGGDLHLRAQHRLRIGQEEAGVQVRPIPLERLVRLHVDQQVEVALRAAVDPGLAGPRDAQPRPPFHPRGDLDLELVLPPYLSAAAAVGALLADDLPAPLTLRTDGHGDELAEEGPLHLLHLPASSADRTGLGGRAGLGPGAPAALACLPTRDLQGTGHPVGGLQQGDAQRHLQVSAAARRVGVGLAAPHPPPEYLGEEIAEDVPEIPRKTAAPKGVRSIGRTELVVPRPFFGIAQHGVRRVDLLELLLGLPAAMVRIRMVLARKLAVRPLDLRLRGVARDTQDLIQIFQNKHTPLHRQVAPLWGRAGLHPRAPMVKTPQAKGTEG